MSGTWRICGYLFRDRLKNPRVYIGLLFAAAMILDPIQRYLTYSINLKEYVNLLEPFIIVTSLRDHMVFPVLGALIIFSDVPFITPGVTHVLLRVSRKQWLKGSFLYILVMSVLYVLFIGIVSALFVSRYAYFANFWSDPMHVLAVHFPEIAQNARTYYPYPNVLRAMPPIRAALTSGALLTLYIAALSEILFIVNIIKGKIYGWLVTAAVHATGYIMISDAMNGPPIASLLAHSLLSQHNLASSWFQPGSLSFSALVFLILFAVIHGIGQIFMKNFDYQISVGDKA